MVAVSDAERNWRPSAETPTKHLRVDTWPPRTRTHGVGSVEEIRAAWERGQRLNMAHAPHGLARVPNHDEARYDCETQIVLFRRDDVLVTCYSVREEAITNDHGVAVRQAVEAQFGAVEDSSSTDNRFTEPES